MEIRGKIALILGGAKGIGKEIGFALARSGATVVLTYFDWPEESTRMQEELHALGGDHLTLKADLRDPEQIRHLLQAVRDRFGALHILINNIERGGMPVVHGPYVPEQWDLEMDTTLKAKWWTVHHAMPLLKQSGEGVIVNISSIAGVIGRSGPAGLIFNDGYAAANRAISSFTETWAREGAPEVRANELMLGMFGTRHAEGTRGWTLLSEAQRNALIDRVPLRRTGNADDVVKAVFFLVRDADYMTGSVIRLDGGYTVGAEQVPAMPAGVLE